MTEVRKYDPALVAAMREYGKMVVADIVEELVNVQPMDPTIMKRLFEAADKRSEEEMRADGYEPVDSLTKLLWVKKA